MKSFLYICNCFFPYALLFLTSCASAPSTSNRWNIDGISIYDSGREKGTEIISVQQSSLRAVISNFDAGESDILDISQPSHLKRIARFSLNLAKGEELTSVAFHPSLDVFAAVIDSGNNPGRLEIHSATNGSLIDQINVGYGPDAVVFSEDGNLAMIANEGEDFWFDRSKKEFFTPEGSISIIRFTENGRISRHKLLKLANMSLHKGLIITEGGRFLEREVDWNGNGVIDKKVDFDGNGTIDNQKRMKLGLFEGYDVYGVESKGETKILIPIKTHSPALLEPEYISITPDASKAFVTLQEDDAVAVVDLDSEQIINYFGLGVTKHKTDDRYEGWVKFDHSMVGLREPDGITTIDNGRYFITADEGDTNSDDSIASSHTLSGGRSVSVFDATTGALVGDTGNQLDETAFANHVYPERRSGNKGSEPEMLVSFELNNEPYVAVGMERAASVELISLSDPAHPKVISLGKIAGDEDKSPEGIAHFVLNEEHYLLTANEMNGTVECFRIIPETIDNKYSHTQKP